ncbi:hypothetical protein ACFLYU_04515 [Candidatus Dependentiae bacterium]
MSDNKKNLKEDINFLEYPNWVVNSRSKTSKWVIEKENGKYEVIAPLGLPSHFDKIVLYYLLHRTYGDGIFKKYSLVTNRHQIAKNVFFGVKNIGKHKYDRIMSSLKTWTSTTIFFDGLFFEKDEYTSRYFHVIDEVVLKKESGELIIRFNEGYIKQLCETKFYKYIDFEQYKKFSRASSARLYEILVKSFKTYKGWTINIKKLAEKLTFEKRDKAKDFYPSDVLRQLRPSIKEINKKTDLYISFKYNKNTNICIFTKLKKTKETFIPAILDKKKKEKNAVKQKSAYLARFKSLSIEDQNKILKEIKRQPFLEFLPNQDARIFAYMSKSEKWQLDAK